MNTLHALLLGVLQGLTEFLPVSSSGHLVLLQNLFGFHEPEVLLDIGLHGGTLIATLVVFYREIADMLLTLAHLPARIRSSGGLAPLFDTDETFRCIVLIVAGSIPTAVLGILFHRIVDRIFGTVWLVGLMLLVTGTVLFLTRNSRPGGRKLGRVSVTDALIIGLVQGVAIIPGISRSGSTISTALFLKIDRDVAGRYSFLLSIPALVGALILGIESSALRGSAPAGAMVIGALAAGGVGYAALRLLLKLVRKGRLHRFAPYCWIAGGLALVLSQ